MRTILSTNLATGMISLFGLQGGHLEMRPVSIDSLKGVRGINSLNNLGIQKWLQKKGVQLEGSGKTKFQLFPGDVLYLVLDPPGQKDDVILSFKDKNGIPETIKPVIIKVTAMAKE